MRQSTRWPHVSPLLFDQARRIVRTFLFISSFSNLGTTVNHDSNSHTLTTVFSPAAACTTDTWYIESLSGTYHYDTAIPATDADWRLSQGPKEWSSCVLLYNMSIKWLLSKICVEVIALKLRMGLFGTQRTDAPPSIAILTTNGHSPKPMRYLA